MALLGEGDRGDAEVGLVEPPSGRLEPSPERTVHLSGILVEGRIDTAWELPSG
jgi:hypothetical protein